MSAPNQYIGVPNDIERKGQLDSLRAFAIIPVLYTHFWSSDSWTGTAGVILFFVLSGYLITGILLRVRNKPSALRTFYIRRFLRIFPIYYTTLALAALINLQQIRHSLPWHALYLSNVWFSITNEWSPWCTAHLWTLSVEEQFYVVWPLLILFLPAKAIRPVVWCAILTAVIFRMGAAYIGIEGLGKGILTPACLDSLGAGALLALAKAGDVFPRWLANAGWAAALIVVLLGFPNPNPSLVWLSSIRPELLTVAFAAAVAAASAGISGLVGAILNSKGLRYVGRISYGIYVFHLFIYGVISGALGRLDRPPLDRGPFAFLLLSAITVAAAAISWHFFEQPINRFKERIAATPEKLPAIVRPGVA